MAERIVPKAITISRRDFIGAPCTFCPKCHKQSFGVLLGVGSSHSYDKECTDCGHRVRYQLPKIKKRIVYLDQFVIDNIVKSLDPKHPKHEAALKEPFWIEAYKKLDVLTRAQLIVCPDSFFHRQESGPTGYFESMQRIYEHFSGGATFDHSAEITRMQVCEHFRNYLRGSPDTPPVTAPESIVHGDFHEWGGRIRVSVSMKPRGDEVSEIVKRKTEGYKDFLEIFERWKTEKTGKFDDWYNEETRGFVLGTAEAIKAFIQRKVQAPEKFLRDGTVDLNDIIPPPSLELVQAMERVAYEEGITEQEKAFLQIRTYLSPVYLEKVPSIHIGSLLLAALADQAAHGRVQPPSPGVLVDIEMISNLLPYCEAIFLDKDISALLDDARVKSRLGVATQIFSLRNKVTFLSYLDQILNSADKKHLEFVEAFYGSDWQQPYLTILSH